MKKLLLLALFISAQSSFAAGVFCKIDNKLVDVFSQEGHFDCLDAIRDGEACYLGEREDAFKLISDLQDTDFNWDEMWIEGIHLKGKSEIGYSFVDGPNETRKKQSFRVCR